MSWFDIALQNYYRQKELQQEAAEKAFANVGQSIGQFGQNMQANQVGARMANSGAYAPRAGLVGMPAGTTLPAGVSTVGTAPARFTGGVPALQAAIEMQKNQQAQQSATVEQALKRAQTGEAVARTGAIPFHTQAELQRSTGATPEAKAATAAQKEAEKIALQNADSVPRLTKELKDIYGEDGAQQWMQGFLNNQLNRGSLLPDNTWKGDPNGPMVTADPSTTNYKSPVTKPFPVAPVDAMQPYLDRYRKIQGAGGRYIPPAAPRVPGQVAPTGNPAVANPAIRLPVGANQVPGQGYPSGPNPTNQQVLPPGANMQSDYFQNPQNAARPVGSGYGAMPPTGQEPVRVNTREEALALPPGTSFIDAFGVTRIRP